MERNEKVNVTVAVVLLGVVCGMVGLAFAAVPLYKLFCSVTGFAGTTQRATAADVPTAVKNAKVVVTFDTNVDSNLDWSFRPVQHSLTLKVGEEGLALFHAKNNGTTAVTGTASFNVTPYKIAAYFNKVQCFCFTEQTLQPGQEADMPVQFYVDPKILTDQDTKEVHNIVLSYTFHRSLDQSPAKKTSAVVRDSGKSGS